MKRLVLLVLFALLFAGCDALKPQKSPGEIFHTSQEEGTKLQNMVEDQIDIYIASTGREIKNRRSKEYRDFLMEILNDQHFEIATSLASAQGMDNADANTLIMTYVTGMLDVSVSDDIPTAVVLTPEK